MSQLTKEATHTTNLEEAAYFLKGSATHTNGLAQIDPRIIVLLGVVANMLEHLAIVTHIQPTSDVS